MTKSTYMWKMCTAVLLFVLLFIFGQQLSIRKPLWGDEIHTQVNSVMDPSYVQILKGNLQEGNSAPLFYLIQKVVTDFNSSKLSKSLFSSRSSVADLDVQRIVRYSTSVFMALTIVITFLYLWNNFSLLIAGLSLILYFSSFMAWSYWAEARPYSLWMLLTTLQAITFISFLSCKDHKQKIWWGGFSASNILLSLTTIISIVQISLLCFYVFVFRDRSFKKQFSAFVVPLIFCFIYYFSASSHKHPYVVADPAQLIFFNFSDFSVLLFCVYCIGQFFGVFKKTRLTVPLIICTAVILISALAIMLVFKVHEDPSRPVVLLLSNRNLIFLMPVEILTISYIFHDFYKYAQGKKWIQTNITLLFICFLMYRLVYLFNQLSGLNLYVL